MIAREVGYTIKHAILRNAMAIPLRPTGGAYFVPDTFSGVLDKIDTALNMVEGGTFRMHRMDVIRNMRGVSDIAFLLEKAVDRQLDVLQSTILDILKSDTTRESTITKRSKDVSNVLKKAKAYEKLLGVSFSDKKQRMEKMSKLLLEAHVKTAAAGKLKRKRLKFTENTERKRLKFGAVEESDARLVVIK